MKSLLKAVRAPNFAETGTYLVKTALGTKKIYRDPEERCWIEATDGIAIEDFWIYHTLGWTKAEALERLESLYGVPK